MRKPTRSRPPISEHVRHLELLSRFMLRPGLVPHLSRVKNDQLAHDGILQGKKNRNRDRGERPACCHPRERWCPFNAAGPSLDDEKALGPLASQGLAARSQLWFSEADGAPWTALPLEGAVPEGWRCATAWRACDGWSLGWSHGSAPQRPKQREKARIRRIFPPASPESEPFGLRDAAIPLTMRANGGGLRLPRQRGESDHEEHHPMAGGPGHPRRP